MAGTRSIHDCRLRQYHRPLRPQLPDLQPRPHDQHLGPGSCSPGISLIDTTTTHPRFWSCPVSATPPLPITHTDISLCRPPLPLTLRCVPPASTPSTPRQSAAPLATPPSPRLPTPTSSSRTCLYTRITSATCSSQSRTPAQPAPTPPPPQCVVTYLPRPLPRFPRPPPHLSPPPRHLCAPPPRRPHRHPVRPRPPARSALRSPSWTTVWLVPGSLLSHGTPRTSHLTSPSTLRLPEPSSSSPLPLTTCYSAPSLPPKPRSRSALTASVPFAHPAPPPLSSTPIHGHSPTLLPQVCAASVSEVVTAATCNAFGNPAFPMIDPGVITAHLPQYKGYSCNMQITARDSCSFCRYASPPTLCPNTLPSPSPPLPLPNLPPLSPPTPPDVPPPPTPTPPDVPPPPPPPDVPPPPPERDLSWISQGRARGSV